MLKFALSRIVGLVGVLLGVSAIIFCLGALIPGDAVTVILGADGAVSEQAARLRAELGLDRPIVVQYLDWLWGAVRGDFGVSPITGRSVTETIARQLPVSLEATILSVIVSTVLGVSLGVLSSMRLNRVADLVTRSVLLTMFSVPVFVIGVLLLLLSSLYFPQLQALRYTPFWTDPLENLRSMVLPVLTISMPVAAMSMQMTRTSMAGALRGEFIQFARAKGVPRNKVFFVHALKNAFPPILTQLGFTFGILMGGLVVVENIFNLPGLGRGLLTAIQDRDFPLLMAQSLVLAAVFVIVNTCVDLLYPVFDPKQRKN